MGAYSQTIRAHFNEPKNVGCLENADAEGFAGTRRAGPFMRFTVRLRDGRIEEMKFQTFGCAPAIAAGSVLTEALIGKTIAESSEWTLTKLLEALGGLPDDKLHCATLAVEALVSLREVVHAQESGKISQNSA